MSLSVGMNNLNYSSNVYSANASKDVEAKAENTAAEIMAADASAKPAEGKTDTVEISSDKYKVDVDALIEENNKRIQEFTAQLMSMVTKQGEKSNLTLFGKELTVTPEQSAEAAASLELGGEWSVNAVSDRIMNMAYALSGGDESKLQILKDAVIEGFSQAGFDPNNRGTMPEITGQTYDEIMKRFDEWEESGMKTYDTNKPADASVENPQGKGTVVDVVV